MSPLRVRRSSATRRPDLGLLVLLALGLVLRLLINARSEGVVFDLESYALVGRSLRETPFGLYEEVNGDVFRWPYPPGYLPWVVAVDEAAQRVAVDFVRLVRLAPIAADLAIAVVVWWWLGRTGAARAARLASVACVALGPVFILVSSFHGQLDAVAILPALLAVVLWQDGRIGHRGAIVGALIGLGAALKTVPGLLLLAVLPTARSRGEAATVAGVAIAVPVLALLPFLATEPAAVVDSLRYRGVPGLGGLSLLAQPALAEGWLLGVPKDYSALSEALRDIGPAITLAGVALLAWVLARRRPPAVLGAVLVVLVLYVFGVNFFMQYLVWGLPVVLAAGGWRWAAGIQVALVPALVVVYADPLDSTLGVWLGYVVPMLAFYALCTAAFLRLSGVVGGPTRP